MADASGRSRRASAVQLIWAGCRRVYNRLTLRAHRTNARSYWPDLKGVDLIAVAVAFALLRLHSVILGVVWGNAHRLRRWRSSRRADPGRQTVLHVISSFDLGGTQTQLKSLCTSPDRRFDHQCAEIFPELNYLYRRGEAVDPARYVTGTLISRTLGRLASNLNTRSPQLVQTYKLWRDLQAARPEVVVGWGHEMCATTFVAAALARVPHIVFCIRTLSPNSYHWVPERYGRLLHLAHSRMTPLVSTVMANSTLLRDDHRRWLGAANVHVNVCPNGIDPAPMTADEIAARRRAMRAELGVGDDACVVTNVGRFSQEKGQASMVGAAAILKRTRPARNVVWLLCGDGPTLPPLKTQAEELGLTNIRFPGRTTGVSDYLCASDLFVMPSDFEGMPNAMMEAMTYGLACISTNRSGAMDVARDRVEALYYEPGDAMQLADHVQRLLDNPEEARRIGARAKARMQEFSIRRSVTAFETVLDSLTPQGARVEEALPSDSRGYEIAPESRSDSTILR